MSFPCNALQRTRFWSLPVPAWTNWSFLCRINNSLKLFQPSRTHWTISLHFNHIASIGHAGAFLPHKPCKLYVRCSLPCWILERGKTSQSNILTLKHGAFPPTYFLINLMLIWSFPSDIQYNNFAGSLYISSSCKNTSPGSNNQFSLENYSYSYNINSRTWSFPSNISTLEHGAFPPIYFLIRMELSLRHINLRSFPSNILTLEHGAFPPTYFLIRLILIWSFPSDIQQ